MAWRIVKQPNGLYARFADPVDTFTHYDMTREEAIEECRHYLGMGVVEAEPKVGNADREPQRFMKELATIGAVHGEEKRTKMRELLS